MKLTKLFSHSCDEGGLVTRNYVKVFTDSTVKDIRTYYRYLYQNKMYSQLNNFTNAMKMFGFFDGLVNKAKNLWNGVGETVNAAKFGIDAKNTLKAGEEALKDRQSGAVDTSMYKSLDGGKYQVSDLDRYIAYNDSVDPMNDYFRLTDNYGRGNKSWGSANAARESVRTKDQMLEDNKLDMQKYLEETNAIADEAAKAAVKNKTVERLREIGRKNGKMDADIDREIAMATGLIPMPKAQPQQKRRKLVVGEAPQQKRRKLVVGTTPQQKSVIEDKAKKYFG